VIGVWAAVVASIASYLAAVLISVHFIRIQVAATPGDSLAEVINPERDST